MNLTFLSHTAMGGSFVVGSHHLAQAFARRGHRVAHVSAALSLAHLGLIHDPFVRARWKRWLRGGEQIGGVRDVVPVTLVPWQLARRSGSTMPAYAQYLAASPVDGRASLGIETADCLIVDDPRFVGAAKHSSPGQLVVYRATDLYAAMSGDGKIIDAEAMICSRAQLLVATSGAVAAHLQNISGRQVHVITNGVDFEHFVAPEAGARCFDLPGKREDRAVYVGAFDARFSRAGLHAASRALPDKQFILAGPDGAKVVAALGEPNVVALGPVKYTDLPKLLQQCAVGLLPMTAEAANAGRSPMKLYEYAAAGLAIAATATPELQARKLASLCLTDTANDFPAAVVAAFAKAKDAGVLEAARQGAQQEGWSVKADRLMDLIRQACASQGNVVGDHIREGHLPRKHGFNPDGVSGLRGVARVVLNRTGYSGRRGSR
jgi:glycosyltransferase involved in cell wall biosynthesis